MYVYGSIYHLEYLRKRVRYWRLQDDQEKSPLSPASVGDMMFPMDFLHTLPSPSWTIPKLIAPKINVWWVNGVSELLYWQSELFLLVARLVSNGEGESESRVLINSAAPVFTTHPADRSETLDRDQEWFHSNTQCVLFLLYHCSLPANQP